MGVDVVQILRFGRIDVARQVEVVVVLWIGDVGHGNKTRIARDLDPAGERVDDLMDVLLAQPVFRPVLREPFRRVDHEDRLARRGVALVEHDDAGGNAGAVEQVGRETDDPLEIAVPDKVAADRALRAAAEQYAVRQDARAFAGGFERAHNVQQIRVVALLRGRDAVRLETLVRVVFGIEPRAPSLVGKRRICDHVIEGLE